MLISSGWIRAELLHCTTGTTLVSREPDTSWLPAICGKVPTHFMAAEALGTEYICVETYYTTILVSKTMHQMKDQVNKKTISGDIDIGISGR